MMSSGLRWYYANRELASQRAAARYRANSTKIKAACAKWAKQNPEKVRAIAARYRQANPQRARIAHWRKAGIDVGAAAIALIEHDGHCAICRADKPGGSKGWHVDHNHATKKVRGILCCRCNLSLGWAEKYGDKIATYLRENQ